MGDKYTIFTRSLNIMDENNKNREPSQAIFTWETSDTRIKRFEFIYI